MQKDQTYHLNNFSLTKKGDQYRFQFHSADNLTEEFDNVVLHKGTLIKNNNNYTLQSNYHINPIRIMRYNLECDKRVSIMSTYNYWGEIKKEHLWYSKCCECRTLLKEDKYTYFAFNNLHKVSMKGDILVLNKNMEIEGYGIFESFDRNTFNYKFIRVYYINGSKKEYSAKGNFL